MEINYSGKDGFNFTQPNLAINKIAFGKRLIIIKGIYKVKNDYSGKPSKHKAELLVRVFK